MCRRLHYIGSTGALSGLAASLIEADPVWFVGGIAFAYAMAWTGHFAFERNVPATFGNPLWSLIGDSRMYLLWLRGRLEATMQAAQIDRSKSG